jgi:hypothetical protein
MISAVTLQAQCLSAKPPLRTRDLLRNQIKTRTAHPGHGLAGWLASLPPSPDLCPASLQDQGQRVQVLSAGDGAQRHHGADLTGRKPRDWYAWNGLLAVRYAERQSFEKESQ